MSSSEDEIQPFILPVTGLLVNGWSPAPFPTPKDIEIYVDGVKVKVTLAQTTYPVSQVVTFQPVPSDQITFHTGPESSSPNAIQVLCPTCSKPMVTSTVGSYWECLDHGGKYNQVVFT